MLRSTNCLGSISSLQGSQSACNTTNPHDNHRNFGNTSLSTTPVFLRGGCGCCSSSTSRWRLPAAFQAGTAGTKRVQLARKAMSTSSTALQAVCCSGRTELPQAQSFAANRHLCECSGLFGLQMSSRTYSSGRRCQRGQQDACASALNGTWLHCTLHCNTLHSGFTEYYQKW